MEQSPWETEVDQFVEKFPAFMDPNRSLLITELHTDSVDAFSQAYTLFL
jgi:hypothetical protein